jgi:hypothetical protein
MYRGPEKQVLFSPVPPTIALFYEILDYPLCRWLPGCG